MHNVYRLDIGHRFLGLNSRTCTEDNVIKYFSGGVPEFWL